jgi:hypothetical protein
MVDIKGPAIDSQAFRAEGHCCGIRLPALMDLSSAGVQLEMTPDIRAELLKAGIHPTESSQQRPRDDQIPNAQPNPR